MTTQNFGQIKSNNADITYDTVAAAFTFSEIVTAKATVTELAGVTTMVAHVHQAAGSGGTLDHGAALTGLADDDHTQYALASAVNVKRAPYNAVGNGSTDDSTAVLAALNAAIVAKVPLYFPAGTYKITSDGLLSSFTGTYKEGLVVCGDGMDNSILYLASPGVGERWFYNNNGTPKLAFATFRDLRFEGESSTYCSGFAQDSDGHEKDFHFQRCHFKTLATAFKCSGSGNADQNTFYDCRFNEIASKVLHLYDNTQSVEHQFRDCIIYASGDCLYIQKGGNVEMNGCAIMLYGSGAGYVLNDVSVSASDVGTSNDGFSFHRCRTELNHADKKLAYTSFARLVTFDDCNLVNNTGDAKQAVSITERGNVVFRTCMFPADWNFVIRTTIDGYIWSGGEILFDACYVSPTLSEQIIHSNASYPYGRARAINSRSYVGFQGEPYDSMKPLDFYYNSRNSGQQASASPVLSVSVKQSTLTWPYSLSTQRIITLPRTIAGGGVALVGLDLYKPASGVDTTDYALNLGTADHGTVYWTSGTVAYNSAITAHVDLWLDLTDANRVIHLWCDPTGGGAGITGGYCYLRYR